MRATLVRRSRWCIPVLFVALVVSADSPAPDLAGQYREARDRAAQSGVGHIIPALPIAKADALAKEAETIRGTRPGDAARLYREAMWRLPKLTAGSPKELVRLLGNPAFRQPAAVTCIAVDPVEGYLVTGSGDKTAQGRSAEPTVRVWNMADGTMSFEYRGHRDSVAGVAVVAGGRIASAAGKEIHLWKVGEAAKVVTGPSAPVTCIAASPDGARFAIGGEDRVVRLWHTTKLDDPITLNVQNANITDIAVSTKLVATVNAEGTLTVWDLTGQSPRQLIEQRVLSTNSRLTGVSIAPDEKSVAVCGDRTAKVVALPKPDDAEPLGAVKRSFDGANGHADMVRTLAYSPDGKVLATAGNDQSVRIWDVASGQLLRTLLGHTDQVSSLAFSSDGSRLFSGGGDQGIRIWNLESTMPSLTLAGHRGSVWSAVPSPDGRLLATGGADHVIRIWDLASGKELRQLTGHNGPITSIGFLADGKSLISTSGDRSVRYWTSIEGGPGQQFAGPGPEISPSPMQFLASAVAPDGLHLATGGSDSTVRIWDIGQLKQTSQWSLPRSAITAIAYRPDGQRVAVATADGMIRIAEPANGGSLVAFKAHEVGGVAALAFLPNGRSLVSCGGDQMVKVWDVAASSIKDPVFSLAGHTGPVTAIAVSTDGKLIASAGADSAVKVWNLAKRAEIRSLRGHTDWVGALAFSADGTRLFSASVDGRILVWRLPRLEDEDASIGHLRSITAMVVLPNGELLTAAEDRKLIRWNLQTGLPANTMNLPATAISIAVSSDGKFVLGSGDDKRIRKWDMATTKESRIYEAHNRPQLLLIPPSNQEFLSWYSCEGGENDVTSLVQRYAITSGDVEELVSENGKAARSLAFSADGALAAVGSHSGALRIFNLSTKARLSEDFAGNAVAVTDVAFTPDKKLLLSGDRTGEIKAWRVDAKPGEPVFTIKAPAKSVEILTVSPTGHHFAAYGGGVIAVFETQGGKLLRTVKMPHVCAMLFVFDGRQLAAGLTDGTVAILNLSGQ